MKLNKLIIEDAHEIIFEEYFSDKTLIWSKINSSGKTTLVRFILYSLCYDIPSTKRINMRNYKVTIDITNNKKFRITRNNDSVKLMCLDEDFEKNYSAENDNYTIHSILFGINNKKTIDNLLGAYYIDQEKGWTLLNRGKVISSRIHFNVDEFILGISNTDVTKYDSDITKLENEIKRYNAILNVVALSEEGNYEFKEDENYTRLKTKKANIYNSLKEVENQISEIEQIITNNSSLIELIESLKITITIPNIPEPVRVSKDNITDFLINQFILDSQKKELQIERENLNEKLKNTEVELSEYEVLVHVDDISKCVINQVKNSSLNYVDLEHLIGQLKKEKKTAEDQKKQALSSNVKILTRLAEKIKEYGMYLNVFEGYIDKEENYISTSNLKEYTGAIYHKVTLCYRLAYYDCVREFLGLELPFIIDSPGAAEVDVHGMKEMIALIKKVVNNGQIIISSIYNEELNFLQNSTIELENGIFGEK